MQETGLDLWVRKIPWSRKWQPTAVFLPWKCHGQRSLVGNMGFQTVLRQLSNTHKCKKKIFPCFYLECFETLKFLERIDFFFCRLSFNLDFSKFSSWLYSIYAISWQNKSRGHIVCFPGHHIRSHMMSLCPIIGNVNFTVAAIRFLHYKVTIFVESFIESR